MAKGRVSIVVERCKACGFCVEFCPTKVLALSSAFNSKGYHPPHVVAPEKTPLANVLLTFLDRIDVGQDKLGDSTGKLVEA